MTIRLLAGDCRDVLATLPDASVHTVVTSPPYYALRSYLDAGHVDKHREIGLEATPDEYLATMVQVFRAIRRVMRPDATAWVNMGDSFRDKQLLLMPARLALALQADGWWVRSDIIWHKPNPMPESCTDRPTSAHEHVFLLTRSARYFYDADAVREEASRTGEVNSGDRAPGGLVNGGWLSGGTVPSGRNLRNVWTIATHAYSAAHFATFPPELAERSVKAGTSARGCCAQCGAPWRRVVERGYLVPTRKNYDLRAYGVVVDAPDANDAGRNRARDGHRANMAYETTTTGWSPSCTHGGDPVPCTVLDPFAGAGTTLMVADRLQRDAIGIDLNPDYNYMSRARIEADAPLFAAFPVSEPEDERMADLFADDEYQRLPAAVPEAKRDAFRNSARYVNQEANQPNGLLPPLVSGSRDGRPDADRWGRARTGDPRDQRAAAD